MDPATIAAVTPLILQGGAVAVLIWIVFLLTGGKLHTSSEVDGLKRDKEDLLEINKRSSAALEQSNTLLKDFTGRHR